MERWIEMTITVDPFVAGVVTTLFIELVAFLVFGIVSSVRKKKDR